MGISFLFWQCYDDVVQRLSSYENNEIKLTLKGCGNAKTHINTETKLKRMAGADPISFLPKSRKEDLSDRESGTVWIG